MVSHLTKPKSVISILGVCFISGVLLLEKVVAGDLIINEVLPHPAGNADEDSEFIEFFNCSDKDLDISGFVIDDAIDSGSKPYTIPSGVQVSGNGYIIFEKRVSNIALNNSGDVVNLIDQQGQIIDTMSYKNPKEDVSIGRSDGRDSQWVNCSVKTPASVNSCIIDIPSPTLPEATSTPKPTVTTKPMVEPKPTVTSKPSATPKPTTTPHQASNDEKVIGAATGPLSVSEITNNSTSSTSNYVLVKDTSVTTDSGNVIEVFDPLKADAPGNGDSIEDARKLVDRKLLYRKISEYFGASGGILGIVSISHFVLRKKYWIKQ